KTFISMARASGARSTRRCSSAKAPRTATPHHSSAGGMGWSCRARFTSSKVPHRDAETTRPSAARRTWRADERKKINGLRERIHSCRSSRSTARVFSSGRRTTMPRTQQPTEIEAAQLELLLATGDGAPAVEQKLEVLRALRGGSPERSQRLDHFLI